jgi:hypothetical protein
MSMWDATGSEALRKGLAHIGSHTLLGSFCASPFFRYMCSMIGTYSGLLYCMTYEPDIITDILTFVDRLFLIRSLTPALNYKIGTLHACAHSRSFPMLACNRHKMDSFGVALKPSAEEIMCRDLHGNKTPGSAGGASTPNPLSSSGVGGAGGASTPTPSSSSGVGGACTPTTPRPP